MFKKNFKKIFNLLVLYISSYIIASFIFYLLGIFTPYSSIINLSIGGFFNNIKNSFFSKEGLLTHLIIILATVLGRLASLRVKDK